VRVAGTTDVIFSLLCGEQKQQERILLTVSRFSQYRAELSPLNRYGGDFRMPRTWRSLVMI